MSPNSPYENIIIFFVLFCWLAAWDHPYRGTTWQLNNHSRVSRVKIYTTTAREPSIYEQNLK